MFRDKAKLFLNHYHNIPFFCLKCVIVSYSMLFLHILFSQLNTIHTCISVNMSKFLELISQITYYKIENIRENK